MKTQLLKRLFGFMVVTIIFFNVASAQNYFMKTFQIGDRVYYSKAVVTSDHHYMALGTVDTLSYIPNGILLSKYNSDGTVMWTRVYEEGNYTGGSDIVPTPDGGFIITSTYQRQFIRIDSFGEVLFSYGLVDGEFDRILSSPNHGYFLAGSFGGEAQIIHMDSNGQVIWSKKRNNTTSGYSDVTFTPDSGLIATGIESGFFDRMIISSFDTSGNFLWEKKITPPSNDDSYFPSSIVPLSSGGYAIAGSIYQTSGESDIFILKIDDSGNLLHQWRYGTAEWWDVGGALLELNDGSLLIAGGANLGTSEEHQVPFVMRVDSTGSIISGFYYSQSYGDTSTWGLAATFIADSDKLLLPGIIVYPDTLQPGSFSGKAFLFETSISGEGLCFGENYSIPFINDDLVALDNSPQLGNGNSTLDSLTITSTLYSNQSVDFCLSSGILQQGEGMSALNAFPNPFYSTSTITFSLSQSENVSLRIFDVEGRLIRTLTNEVMNAGTHQLTWNASDESGNVVSAGIYFLQLQSTHFSQTQKLMVTH